MRKLGIPPENLQPNRYVGPKAALTPCVEATRRPTTLDRIYPLLTLWRVSFNPSTGSEGEVWQLVKFETSPAGDATWQRLNFSSTGSDFNTATVDAVTAPGVNPVVPDGVGDIDILGAVVANHSVPMETHSRAINTFTIEVQVAKDRNGAPGNKVDAGVCSFSDADFVVDGDGYVTLVGGAGAAVTDIQVDSNTGPGTDPVVPDGAGIVTVSGSAVAAQGIPIETHSRAANAYNIEVQVSKAETVPGNKNSAGVCSFDTSQFTVDGDGWVTLSGAGLAFDEINVQATAGTGVDPVVPTAGGALTFNGGAVVNGGTPVQTISRAPNELNLEVQVATETTVPGDTNDAGICSFDDSQFTVNDDGWVQLIGGGAVPAGAMFNLAFTHDTTTMTMHDRSGAALSITNPGYVALPSNSVEGQIVLHKITANQTLTITDMNGALFGTTTGVAWGNNMPLYVGWIAKDDNTVPIACIARVPNAIRTPTTSTEIGDPNTPAQASVEASVFAWSNLSAYTDYDSNHITTVGSFRATKSGGNVWTFIAFDQQDGTNLWNDNRQFLMPYGQNGASATSHFALNGGTVGPIFGTDNLAYTFYKDGLMDILCNFNGCTTSGVGVVDALIPMPINGAGQMVGTFVAGTTHTVMWCTAENSLGATSEIIMWLTGATAARTLTGISNAGTGNTIQIRGTIRQNVGAF